MNLNIKNFGSGAVILFVISGLLFLLFVALIMANIQTDDWDVGCKKLGYVSSKCIDSYYECYCVDDKNNTIPAVNYNGEVVLVKYSDVQ